MFLTITLFPDIMHAKTSENPRDLYRLIVILDYHTEEMLNKDYDFMAGDWLKKNYAFERVRELDAVNPFLILRHDGHYERYEHVDSMWHINSGFIRPTLDIECYEDYIDSLIDGTPVTWAGNTWNLVSPTPAGVVVDMNPQRYWPFFEARGRKYNLKERILDAREFHNRDTR